MVYRLKNEIYNKYKKIVNMTPKEFELWANNPNSKLASIDRRPIKRTKELLKTKRKDWNSKHSRWALKSISFIKRMKKMNKGIIITKDGLSRRDIALKNWGYNLKK